MSLSDTLRGRFSHTVAPLPGALEALAPIAANANSFDFSSFLKAAQMPVETLGRLQADALDHLWPAMAHVLNDGARFWQREFQPGDLKEIYTGVAKHVHLVQLQTPALVPVHDELKMAQRMIDASDGEILHCETRGTFGDATYVANDIDLIFGLMNFRKDEAGTPALVAIPTVGLPGWMIEAFETAGQRSALQALQRIVSYVSHDYYHQMQPINDNTFFDKNLLSKTSVGEPFNSFLNCPATHAWAKLDGEVFRIMKERSDEADPDVFEHHALMFQSQVFNALWSQVPVRAVITQDIDDFITGVAETTVFHGGKTLHEGDVEMDHFALGALSIMTVFLRRAAADVHPVFGEVFKRINARFDFRAGRMPDILGGFGRHYSDTMKSGGMVLATARRMAEVSFGVTHTLGMLPLHPVSRTRATEEMRRARRGFAGLHSI